MNGKRCIVTGDDLYRAACAAIAIIERAGGEARLAGGCVRDRLRGVTPKDYDIATTTLPQETVRIFRAAGYRTIPTGIKHGTITLLASAGAIEITTLRSDIETDGRHVTKLAFSKSFAEDAARRDFTVNAMFEDRHGKVYDFFQGHDDLQAKRLVFVGEPIARIEEDYLRIMRLFRFQAQLGFTPRQDALDAVLAGCAGLASVSQERITAELLATLNIADISAVLRAMQSCGVLTIILPEVNAALPWGEIERSAALDAPYRWLARLALLLCHLAPPQLATVLRRLKLSNHQQQLVSTALLNVPHITELAPPRSALMAMLDDIEHTVRRKHAFLQIFYPIWKLRNLSREFHTKLALLHDCEVQFGELRRQALPLSGTDLMQAFALSSSPVVGELLQRLRTSYREEEWQTRAEGLALAKKLLSEKK